MDKELREVLQRRADHRREAKKYPRKPLPKKKRSVKPEDVFKRAKRVLGLKAIEPTLKGSRHQFREMDQRLRALEKEMKRRTAPRKCNWTDKGEVLAYNIDAKRNRRERKILEFAPGFMCQRCGNGPFVKKRQWVATYEEVVVPKHTVATKRGWLKTIQEKKYKKVIGIMCRGCFKKEQNRVMTTKRMEVRYDVNGDDLKRARQLKGLSQLGMAAQCGWTRGYQSNMENATVTSLSESTYKIMLEVLGVPEI